MPLSPRFRRVAALERRFVNREGALEAFADELSRVGDRPRVLNVTGVGGIGKSRLLRELRNRVAGSGGCRTAVLDLQVPAMRQQENALAVLRTEFGRQEVSFDRFDIAYAVLWQRLHPNLRITSRDLPFLAESEVLTTIVADASGVPVFGTAIGLLKLAERATSWMRRKRAVQADEVLQMLDELGNTEVLDAVTYLFAEELRSAGGQRPFVVFVDAYEALVPTPVRSGRVSSADTWLRDLISQLGRGLVVVASREPLNWQTYDTDWAEVIRDCPVLGLPAGARRELLAEAGILDVDAQRAIARASEGLPFYLHLAIDTGTAASARDTNVVSVVSSEEIVQRFLQHVAPVEVRCLELLSVARIFDFGIFQALTGAFELPSDRMTWESLTAYSFVYPAGDSEHRLHQLMAAALRERLSPPVVRDAHGLLRALWDRRTLQDGTIADVRGFREGAYHGVRAEAMPAEDVLDHADQAVRYGGKQAADGMVTDLREYLRDGTCPEVATTSLARVAQCLAAEAAILMGDAATAGRVATSGSWPDLARPADARLAIAAAHARRISGDTTSAGHLYDAVWRHHGGPARHTAGLWVADIHMWQGRFATAFALCREILDSCDPGAQELRGDVLRLMHLGYRFHLDFASAASALQQARECYQLSGAVVGLANIATNQVELLAWTDPGAALAAAPAALDAQQELGALHELGKTHTAIAIAQTRLGDHSAAAASFETARTYLKRARYRSGLARAEFFHGFLHASQGHSGQAAACLTGAVSEFIAAEVYPTLIVLAAQALDHLGQTDVDITRAASAARTRIEPLDSITNLDDRAAALIAAMLGAPTVRWRDLYDTAAAHLDAAAGYYNNNVRVDTPTGPVNVRIPIPGADVMDLRLWREEEILPTIAAYVRYTPPLLHASAEPRYQVHEFIDGPVLNTIAPRGVAVPAHVPADVVALLSELTTVPREKLPATPAGWPQDDDTITFARRLSGLTRRIYATYRDRFAPQFQAFGFPVDPVAVAEAAWPALRRRPLVCVHADIHRKNVIIKAGASYFLDWELALWGDPVYDLAVHFHKMGYTPAERDQVLHLWQTALPPECTAGWEHDLDVYLAHEQIKSAIVDTVRYTHALANPRYAPEPDHVLVDKLTVKLHNAHHRWGTPHRADPPFIEATLRTPPHSAGSAGSMRGR